MEEYLAKLAELKAAAEAYQAAEADALADHETYGYWASQCFHNFARAAAAFNAVRGVEPETILVGSEATATVHQGS